MVPLLSFHLYCTETDVTVYLEQTEYFVDEDEGYVEICAVMTTSCSECSLVSGDITLSITADTATGEQLLLCFTPHKAPTVVTY